MPNTTAFDKHRDVKSSLTSSKLTRQPIHDKSGKKEGDKGDEEIDTDPPEELYPLSHIKEDLTEIKKQNKRNQRVQDESDRRKKEHQGKPAVRLEEASKFRDFCSLKVILFFLFSIVTLCFGIIFNQPEEASVDKTIDLKKFITDMEKQFKGQDLQTFRILKTSLKRVVNENSTSAAPSIVTIITNKGAEITASDFSNYIARELAYGHYVSINESALNRNPDKLKYIIDTQIKTKFDNRSLNVAVVDKFQNIPIDAAMIFHSYCDHENAPFKRAIFLFIVHLNRKIPENPSLRLMDDAAMETLRMIWRDASDDIVDSLITRLTVNVINIK